MGHYAAFKVQRGPKSIYEKQQAMFLEVDTGQRKVVREVSLFWQDKGENGEAAQTEQDLTSLSGCRFLPLNGEEYDWYR